MSVTVSGCPGVPPAPRPAPPAPGSLEISGASRWDDTCLLLWSVVGGGLDECLGEVLVLDLDALARGEDLQLARLEVGHVHHERALHRAVLAGGLRERRVAPAGDDRGAAHRHTGLDRGPPRPAPWSSRRCHESPFRSCPGPCLVEGGQAGTWTALGSA